MQLLKNQYEKIVDEICDLRWPALTREELLAIAHAYYYFSVQFCETVEIACRRFPDDRNLQELRNGECMTDNLSPYPGIAAAGEKMNHDEFMRRVVAMSQRSQDDGRRIDELGQAYLAAARRIDPDVRVASLPTYEDGGLARVFTAVLDARDWDDPALAAFHHFLVGHVRLDSNPDMGHGALCRHLVPDDRIVPLWQAFRDLLAGAAPRLAR
ncbi:hypothetical protein [Rhodopila globiformis]|uniref:Heme oxygenase n=1 Tax=Rhodopila globiformis TaxID=1071 RepID=A0A2S6N8L5_RHOGL|nr:hypothetical protein [Rhodopila globiformis]PPQ30927.1 hypothetical protein CCS01_18425 [Rhodopila globiformis]